MTRPGRGGTPPSPRGYGVPDWRGFTSGARNVRAGTASPLAEDPSTPAVVSSPAALNNTVTSASFSPPANSLLVAMVTAGAGTTASTNLTISDSGSHTWTTKQRLNNSGSPITSGLALFETFLTTAPGSITVTAATNDGTANIPISLSVRVLTGVSSTQASTGTVLITNGFSSNLTGTITLQQTGSLVYVAMNENLPSISPLSNTTLIAQDVNTTGWYAKSTGQTTQAGSATYGWTVNQAGTQETFNMIVQEIAHV